MSAEKTGKNDPSLPVPPEEEERGARGRAAAAGGGASAATVRRSGSRDAAGRCSAGRPLCGAGSGGRPGHQSSPTPSRSRFRRRRRPALASPTSSSATRQNSVDLWFFDLARPDPLQFTGRGSADIAPNDTGDVTGVASYDQGEWSVIFKRPLRATSGAPFVQGSSCRSPSRFGTGSRASVATSEASRPGIPSTSSRKWSHRPSARW